jgi:hypothetical protein
MAVLDAKNGASMTQTLRIFTVILKKFNIQKITAAVIIKPEKL